MKHPVAVEGLEAKNSIFALLVSTAELSNWLIDSFSLLSIEAESAKKDPFHFIFKTSIIFIFDSLHPHPHLSIRAQAQRYSSRIRGSWTQRP
jgi:ubiquitin C-terminal hydrolase